MTSFWIRQITLTLFCQTVELFFFARSNHDGPLRVLFSIVGSCITEKLQNLDVCWRLKWYKSFTHKKMVNTAEGKFANLKDIEGERCKSESIEDTSESDQQTPHFTRSNVPIYDKGHYFFCYLPGNKSASTYLIWLLRCSIEISCGIAMIEQMVLLIRIEDVENSHATPYNPNQVTLVRH